MAESVPIVTRLAGLTLIEAIRRIAPSWPTLCGTIRLKLFKIGAVILKNTRRIRASGCPYKELYFLPRITRTRINPKRIRVLKTRMDTFA